MTRSDRLLLVLPAAAVLALYSLFVNLPVQRTLRTVSQRWTEAASKQTKSQDLQLAEARLTRAQRELAELTPRRETLRRDLRSVAADVGDQERRVTAMNALSALVERHALQLVKEGPADAQQATLPKSLAGVAKVLESDGKKPNVLVWRVQLVGTFAAMSGLLTEIAAGAAPVLPIGLELAAEKLGAPQQWTLFVVL